MFLLQITASHSCPQILHFHHTLRLLFGITSVGVNPSFLSEGKHISKTEHNTPQKNAIIKNVKTGGELVIQVTPNEAGDPIYIDLEVISEDGSIIPIQGIYQTALARGTQKKSVNILSDLLHMYSYGLKPRKDTGEKDNAASEGEPQADSLKG